VRGKGGERKRKRRKEKKKRKEKKEKERNIVLNMEVMGIICNNVNGIS
jgi:hypothetical protein